MLELREDKDIGNISEIRELLERIDSLKPTEVLLSQYRSFDTNFISKNLNLVYREDQDFHFRHPKILRHIVRKIGITGEILQLIYDDFLKIDLEDRNTHLLDLAQIVKYAVMHGAAITIEELIKALKTVADPVVQAELLYAITHKIKREGVTLEASQCFALQEVAKSNRYFFDKSLFNIPQLTDVETDSPQRFTKIRNAPAPRARNAKQEVVKQQQVVKTTKTSDSSEKDMIILSLQEVMQEKRAKARIQVAKASTPSFRDELGRDRTRIYTTYGKVIQLYQHVSDRGTLKQDDRDNYLPYKLLNNEVKRHPYGAFASFIIDISICKIFHKISQKQVINAIAIEGLLNCLINPSELLVKLFGTNKASSIADLIINQDICRGRYASSPIFVAKLAEQLRTKGIVDLKIGYFYCNYKTNPEKIMDIILPVIEDMQLDALTAIYYSVLRDKTILNKKAFKKIEFCLRQNFKLKKLALNIIGELGSDGDFDNKAIFNEHLSILTEFTETCDRDASITFLSRQAHDKIKCPDLFSNDTTLIIIKALISSKLTLEECLGCIDCLDGYLRHTSTPQLLPAQLELIIDHLLVCDRSIQKELLKLILLSVEKNKTLPDTLVNKLLAIIKSLDSDSANLVILIMESIVENTAIDINLLSYKLSDTRIIVAEMGRIQFIARDEEHEQHASIAGLSAKIIVKSLSDKKCISLAPSTVADLVKSIGGDDLQARILSAKALFLALENHKFTEKLDYAILFELQNYAHEPVIDVRIYTHLCYVEGLLQHTFNSNPVPEIYLEHLSELYVFEETLSLHGLDFKKRINQGILSVLFNEVKKNKSLNEDLLRILNFVFVADKDYTPMALNILTECALNGQCIPQETVELLESLVGTGEYHETALNLLRSLIKNKQSVNEKTLHLLIEILTRSDDKILRNQIVECLCIAEENQDLPDDVFKVLELERAALSIRNNLPDKDSAVYFINEMAMAGTILPINILDVLLEEETLPENTYIILRECATNKQILPVWAVEKLASSFIENNISEEQIDLFYHLVKNNQNLPKALIEKLITIDENHHLFQKMLSIFMIMAQRGESIPPVMIKKIMAFALKVNAVSTAESLDKDSDHLMILSCVTSLYSFLQNKDREEHDKEAQVIFIKHLVNHNPYIQEVCIKGLYLLATYSYLSKDSFDQLFALVEDERYKTITPMLLKTLEKFQLTEEQAASIVLAKISAKDDSEYLNQCLVLSKKIHLLKSNFNKIHKIITNTPALQKEALSLLLGCQNINNIPANMIESIIIIMMTNSSSETKTIASNLLQEIAQKAADVGLKERILFTTSPERIPKVSILSVTDDRSLNEAVLSEYKKSLPSLNKQQLDRLLAKLVQSYSNNVEPNLLDLRILECIAVAIPLSKDPTRWYSILINNLDHKNPKISSICFWSMKELDEKGYRSWRFQQKFHSIQRMIHKNTYCLITDPDILATFVSCTFISVPEDREPKHWIKDLIFSDWKEKYKLDDFVSLMFYKSWVQIEKKLTEPNQYLILLHRLETTQLNYDELKEIVDYLPYIDLETFRTTLLYSESIYDDLKVCWLKKMIANKLSLEHVEPNYLAQVTTKMMTKLKTHTAEKLLTTVVTINQFIELEEAVDLLERYNLTADDIDIHPTILSLNRSLEIKVLQNNFTENKSKFNKVFETLLKLGWGLERLQSLTQFVLKRFPHAQIDFIQCLELIAQYEIRPEYYDPISTIFASTAPDEWLKKQNEFVFSKSFPYGQDIKEPTQLIEELLVNNNENTALDAVIKDDLHKALEQINGSDLTTKIADLTNFPIANWTTENILAWANKVRSNSDYTNNPDWIIESIAVARRANLLATGFKLTNTQILSCLIAFNNYSDKGRLQQVATGEGKTVIIAIFAIIRVLQGHKVDVITSSPVRAELDTRSQAPLYKLFGITTSDNLDRSPYVKGAKACYHQDVVYGDVSQFQFDTLRDEYSLLKTKAGRASDAAIFDEVDSILIDDSTKIAKLSSPIAGMDQLVPIYHFIWQQLGEIQKRIIEIDGKLYLLYGRIRYEGDRYILCYEKNGIIEEISDLKHYLKSTTDISSVGQVIDDNIEDFFTKILSDYIKKLIDKRVISCPANFKAYVDGQLPKWIKNAVMALMDFHENIHYIVEDGKINPVAYNSNGTVQSSTSWSDGLHQFLQLKHELKVTPETFTTNFLSNHAYFERYKTRLFGLTGTLGSKASQDVLRETYHLDLVHIPSIHEKKYRAFESTVADDENEWLEAIYNDTAAEIKKGRGVLIICQTIKDVALIEKFIKSKYFSALIKTYVVNNKNQEKSVEKIHPGEIIIATNLGGRGTDINTDAIENAGGMHVILTFQPDNKRVEDQAFGRTSRQRKLGTGRKIINKRTLTGYPTSDPRQIDAIRDEMERQELDAFRDNELKFIKVKDALFKQFCALITEIRLAVRKKSQGILLDTKAALDSLTTDVEPGPYESTIVAAVEERWALFLRKIDDKTIDFESIDQEYKAFANTIRTTYESGTLIQNACHDIAIANHLIINESFLDTFYQEASAHCNAAIKKDPTFSAAAYVAQAWLALKHKKSTSSKGYKEEAMFLFGEAKKLLADEIAHVKAIHVMLHEQGVNPKTDLVKQLALKLTLLGSYLNYIDSAIIEIKKSRRLINIQSSIQYQNSLTDQEPYHKSLASEHITYFDLERGNSSLSKLLINDTRTYSVQFSDLLSYSDTVNLDQAINTITNAYSDESALRSDATNISISLTDVDLGALSPLFQPTFKIHQADKEQALKALKGRASRLNWLSRGPWTDTTMLELEIISDTTGAITKSKITIAKAQELITKETDKVHYNIIFPNQNESLKPFSVSFLSLTTEELKGKFSAIHAANVDLELVGTKADLLALLYSFDFEKIELISVTDTAQEVKCYRISAVEAIKAADKEPLMIRLKNLTTSAAKTICATSKSLEIKTTFNDIDIATSMVGLESGMVDARWTSFTAQKAKALIPLLRAERLDFILGFDQLTHNEAKAIIEKADITQEAIKISRVRQLKDQFLGCGADAELADLDARGLQYTLELNELNFIPWRSICILATLSAIQMSAGAVLIASGYGASVGIGLVTEGVVDLAIAYRAYNTRNFSWSDYSKQKAVSLIISSTCIGLQALKDAGKGLQTVYSAVTQEAIEQAGTQVVVRGKDLGQIITASGNELKKLALRQIGVNIGEAGAREILFQTADSLTAFSFEQYRPRILSSIRDKVSLRFSETSVKRIMRRMLAIDAIQGTNTLSARMDYCVKDIMSPTHTFWRSQWDSIGWPLCRGILSDPKYLSSPFSISVRLCGILNGLTEIVKVIDSLHEQLTARLTKIEDEVLSLAHLLQKNCALTPTEAAKAIEQLKKHNILDEHENIISLDCKSVDFSALALHKDKIIAFLTRFHDAYESVDSNHQITLIADAITDNIIRTTEKQLVAPVTTLCVASLTSAVSTQIQTALIKRQHASEINQIKGEIRNILGKEGQDRQERGNRLEGLSNDLEDRIYLSKFPKITYEDEITRVSTEHNIAYSQLEMVFWAKKTTAINDESRRAKSVAKELAKYAHDVSEDKPANLSDMMLIASLNNIKLKVVTSPHYHVTEEDIKTNTQIVFFSCPMGMIGENNLGHWCLLGTDGNIVEIDSDENNCGYAIISHLTGKSIKDLRANTAQAINDNPQDFHHALQAQDWLGSHYPIYRHQLLMEGAKENDPKPLAIEKLGIVNDAYNASLAAYHKKCTKIGDLKRIDYQKAKGLNTAVGVYLNQKTENIFITFEGTDGALSWVDNAPIFIGADGPICLRNCDKILGEYIASVREKYPNAKITLTGHSKGALIASVLSDKYGLPAIVFDNPGTIIDEFKFSKVISIQSTPNIVNGVKYSIEFELSTGTNGTLLDFNGLWEKKYGKIIELTDDASLIRRFFRRCIPLAFASHKLDYMAKLIKKYPKNQNEIAKKMDEFTHDYPKEPRVKHKAPAATENSMV